MRPGTEGLAGSWRGPREREARAAGGLSSRQAEGGNRRAGGGGQSGRILIFLISDFRFLASTPMFQVYLPIAEISVNLLVMLGLGAAVGFLSGMFGVGGGFLLTPFLMFSGISAPIAVATGANQIVATSVSGALAQWRRNNIDFRMGAVLDRRRRGRRAGRRVPAQAAARGGPGRPHHLAHLCGPARRGRHPDAGREPPRHQARARRQARLGAASPDSTIGFTGCRSSCAFPARASISAPSRRW